MAKSSPGQTRLGPIALLMRFVRQVFAELRKVVRPTRQELITYSSVVLVFVLIVMAFIGLVDYAVGQGVLALFG